MLGYIRTQPILLELKVVHAGTLREARYDILSLERSFQRVFKPLCQAIEPENRSEAALAIFGFVSSVRDESMTQRRQYAGQCMGYPPNSNAWDAFRKRHEPRIVKHLTEELYLLEQDARAYTESLSDTASRGQAKTRAVLGSGHERTIPHRGYAIIGSRFSYEVASDDFRHHIQTIAHQIKVADLDPRPFKLRYRWSGHGEERVPKVRSPGHRILGEPIKMYSWKIYYIHIDNDLHVGQDATIEVEQELWDYDKDFTHILAP